MKSHRQSHFSSTTTFRNDHFTPSPVLDPASTAAIKIQSTYRAHLTRTHFKTISAVHSQSRRLQHLIQRQDTVDAIRRDSRERLRINEALMGILLTLDGVPGRDPVIRELRRSLSRRIVGMQEVVDAVAENKMEGCGETRVEGWDGFWVWDMEEEVCREKGGDEMERFCAEHLGFRCLERFLRDQF